MRKGILLAAAALGLIAGTPARAAPVLDCPLGKQALSTQSPLADVLAVPAAKAAIEAASPGLPEAMTHPFNGHALPPGFDRIVTPRAVMAMLGKNDAALGARLDKDLAKVRLTTADVGARCRTYDNDRPAIPADLPRPSLLVFGKITGFRDSPSVNAAEAALKGIAARHGWGIVFTDKGGVFNARDLAHFDAVVWNNISGDALTIPQRAAFRRYVEHGGGFAGIHGSGGDPQFFWDWYADSLIGARFIGHPMTPQFQEARVVVEDKRHPATYGLPADWRMTEEWYSFNRSVRSLPGARVLASLDESTYKPGEGFGQKLAMGDHPIAWTRCLGKGRSFYTAIGHRPENYSQPESLKLLDQGVMWAMGLSPEGCGSAGDRAK
ncbi:ThuA domain-containing protein [Novosphingobium jiangmenense]|uniref:ThuA domain-containing protein n=1 Tax=Novosphingobium jiangmenense TaxID=2791981 RepID=A0ABS0HDL3_9SPHN|nr:ThuA domain-containing protein [Novosphingobium jiangmenense]